MLAAALVALALAAPPATHDVLRVVVPPASAASATSGVDFQFTWGGAPGVLPHLSVFDRPRRAGDALPPAARGFARDAGGNAARSRRLLTVGGSSVYAWPARDGTQLCVMREPHGGGSCVESFVHGAYPQVQPRDAVWGLVDDGATRVDVVVGPGTIHATLGHNAFYLPLPHGSVLPRRIVVHERSGVRHVYVIERLRPA